MAFEPLHRGQAGQFDHGRVHVEEFRPAGRTGHSLAGCPDPRRSTGRGWTAPRASSCRVIPFSPRCQPWSDQSTTTRLTRPPALVERIEDAADLAIHEAGARQVGPDQRPATDRSAPATTIAARADPNGDTRRNRGRRRDRRASSAARATFRRDGGRTTASKRSRGHGANGTRPR